MHRLINIINLYNQFSSDPFSLYYIDLSPRSVVRCIEGIERLVSCYIVNRNPRSWVDVPSYCNAACMAMLNNWMACHNYDDLYSYTIHEHCMFINGFQIMYEANMPEKDVVPQCSPIHVHAINIIQ